MGSVPLGPVGWRPWSRSSTCGMSWVSAWEMMWCSKLTSHHERLVSWSHSELARGGMGMPFHTIEEAIDDIRQGKMVVLVDDEDRENEGDLTIAAEKVTPEAINFMTRYGRGLICLSLTSERLA